MGTIPHGRLASARLARPGVLALGIVLAWGSSRRSDELAESVPGTFRTRTSEAKPPTKRVLYANDCRFGPSPTSTACKLLLQ